MGVTMSMSHSLLASYLDENNYDTTRISNILWLRDRIMLTRDEKVCSFVRNVEEKYILNLSPYFSKKSAKHSFVISTEC